MAPLGDWPGHRGRVVRLLRAGRGAAAEDRRGVLRRSAPRVERTRRRALRAVARHLRIEGAAGRSAYPLPAGDRAVAGRDRSLLSGRNCEGRVVRGGVRSHGGPMGAHGRHRHTPEGRRHDGALLRGGRVLRQERSGAPQGESLAWRGGGIARTARAGQAEPLRERPRGLRARHRPSAWTIARRRSRSFPSWRGANASIGAGGGAACRGAPEGASHHVFGQQLVRVGAGIRRRPALARSDGCRHRPDAAWRASR